MNGQWSVWWSDGLVQPAVSRIKNAASVAHLSDLSRWLSCMEKVVINHIGVHWTKRFSVAAYVPMFASWNFYDEFLVKYSRKIITACMLGKLNKFDWAVGRD